MPLLLLRQLLLPLQQLRLLELPLREPQTQQVLLVPHHKRLGQRSNHRQPRGVLLVHLRREADDPEAHGAVLGGQGHAAEADAGEDQEQAHGEEDGEHADEHGEAEGRAGSSCGLHGEGLHHQVRPVEPPDHQRDSQHEHHHRQPGRADIIPQHQRPGGQCHVGHQQVLYVQQLLHGGQRPGLVALARVPQVLLLGLGQLGDGVQGALGLDAEDGAGEDGGGEEADHDPGPEVHPRDAAAQALRKVPHRGHQEPNQRDHQHYQQQQVGASKRIHAHGRKQPGHHHRHRRHRRALLRRLVIHREELLGVAHVQDLEEVPRDLFQLATQEITAA
mmetsp:Transcript_38168/g.91708  ORF Transcript_38168/g.91708 Transcript_38168/m.91708 type:complete len:332 (+) Transcript_38168:598-1593(+)